MAKEMYMDDVRDISLVAFQVIENKLKEFDITLTPEQEDGIYIPLSNSLEQIAKYPDYRSYN